MFTVFTVYFGSGDFRTTALRVRNADGNNSTFFDYINHEIYDGVVAPGKLPAAHVGDDANVQTLEISLYDHCSRCMLFLYYTVFYESDVIVRYASLRNEGSEDVTVEKFSSLTLDLPGTSYDLVSLVGSHNHDREICQRTPLFYGNASIMSRRGASSHQMNPFIAVCDSEADENQGDVYGFNLVYSGNFKLRTFSDMWGGTHITYGINDEDFSWVLADGDSFVTPQAVVCYSSDGIDGMSRNMHDFVRNHVVAYRHDREYKPVLFNSWEGCYFNFTTDSIISYIDDAAKIGAELFVLDDGWFGRRNDDRDGLGDWHINTDKIDLGKVIAHCHAKGIKFGIWFEPEMINFTSDLFKEHPDYALREGNEDVFLGRHQMHLDMTRDDVVDNIYNQMIAVLDKYDVDYLKWDYNRRVYEHYSGHLGAERQGEVYHRLTLGYYKLLGRIAARYPDMMIEGWRHQFQYVYRVSALRDGYARQRLQVV